MSRYSNHNVGITVARPSYLEHLIWCVKGCHCAEWNAKVLNPISHELLGVDFRIEQFKDYLHLLMFLEYCQIVNLVNLFEDGVRYTNDASAMTMARKPCDARSCEAWFWSLSGGIRKEGTNLKVYFPDNIPAFEMANGWPGVRDVTHKVKETLRERVIGYPLA